MSARYAEFAVASNFSFLRGASHPEELIGQAAHLELAALGLCDRNSVAGVVRAHLAKRENALELRYHPGARLVFADGTPDILAYPRDRPAWGRLTRLLTRGNLRAEKGDCILFLADLLDHAEGSELIVMPRSTAAGVKPLHPSRTAFTTDDAALLRRRPPDDRDLFGQLCDVAPRSVRLAAAMLYAGRDRIGLAERIEAARRAGVPLIAVNDALYHHPDRRTLHDVLTCIREHVTIDRAGRKLAANAERYLKPPAEMARLFRDAPEAIAETWRLSEALTFSLDELHYEYPDESVPGFASSQEALAHLAHEGAARRYPEGVSEKIRALLDHELALIAAQNYASYFLTVYDIVRFARSVGILCQGRGSAANSAVCYCLGVTEVDPTQHDLLFERFISAERNEPPDIDVDFEHEQREEVIQYIYERYGRSRTGIAATVISYRGRSAIREVGKAFGLSEDMIGVLASSIWGMGGGTVRLDALRAAGLDAESPRVRKIMALAQEIQGFPRHLSQHVGGFVITRSRLDEVIPIMNGAMDKRTHVEWDKDDLDALGILKVDVLGLGMLTCIRKAFAFVEKHYPEWAEADASPSLSSCPALGRASTSSLTAADTSKTWMAGTSPAMTKRRHVATSTSPLEGEVDLRSASRANREGGTRQPPVQTSTPLPILPPQGERVSESVRPSRPLTLSSIPDADPAVYRMLCRADTIGVFQVESRAQMSMLPRLRPKEFYDLVIEVAIVRPGPIQGDMVHPYLRRRQRKEEVSYPSPELEAVLHKTFGVPLFQEQAMRIAIVAGGFTPGEADKLRRAMATFKRTGTIGRFRDKMISGMLARGYTRDFAERCFGQIEGFGEYGFPESHAASFALLVYASAWLKCRYPDAFAAALLNAQPMGFYAPAQIVRDAREHGVEVRPVDVNFSDYDSILESGPAAAPRMHDLHRDMIGDNRATHAIRLGLREAQGLSEEAARLIVERRSYPPLIPAQAGIQNRAEKASNETPGSPLSRGRADHEMPSPVLFPRERAEDGKPLARGLAERVSRYASVRDLWVRTGLPVSVLERLADADAFGSLGLTRRQALWAVKALGRAGDQDDLPLFAAAERREAAEAAAPGFSEPFVALPAMPLGEEVVNDYRFLRLSLRAHPAAFLRADLASRGIVANENLRSLRSGAFVRVSGLVTIRQRPGSAQGVIFMTIEDETSIANIIIWPNVFERFRPIVMGARYVAVSGRMQKESGVIHVVAERLEDLTPLLGWLSADHPPLESRARADAVKRPNSENREKPSRDPLSPLTANAAEIAASLDAPARGSAHSPTRKAATK